MHRHRLLLVRASARAKTHHQLPVREPPCPSLSLRTHTTNTNTNTNTNTYTSTGARAATHQVSRLVVAVCMCVHLFRWSEFFMICLNFSNFHLFPCFPNQASIVLIYDVLQCRNLFVVLFQLCLLACEASWSWSRYLSWFQKCWQGPCSYIVAKVSQNIWSWMSTDIHD